MFAKSMFFFIDVWAPLLMTLTPNEDQHICLYLSVFVLFV